MHISFWCNYDKGNSRRTGILFELSFKFEAADLNFKVSMIWLTLWKVFYLPLLNCFVARLNL